MDWHRKVNPVSYKRYQPGSWAPTRMAWATDNRTIGFRALGQGNGFRIGNRMPGADANPCLEAVVEFYVHRSRLENEAFNNAVTDWGKARYFERI